MVEIILRGVNPSEKEYEATCNHCRTRFKFKRSEAILASYPRETVLKIDCPVCNRGVYIDA